MTQRGGVGQIEVQEHRLAVVLEQDVGRLQVAVDDAAFVGVRQPVRQPGPEPQYRFGIAESLQGGEGFGGMRLFACGRGCLGIRGCARGVLLSVRRIDDGRILPPLQRADEMLARDR